MPATLKSVGVSVKLDNGTDSEGKQLTVSTAMPTMSKANGEPTEAANISKIMAVVAALAPCLSKTVAAIEGTSTSSLTAA